MFSLRGNTSQTGHWLSERYQCVWGVIYVGTCHLLSVTAAFSCFLHRGQKNKDKKKRPWQMWPDNFFEVPPRVGMMVDDVNLEPDGLLWVWVERICHQFGEMVVVWWQMQNGERWILDSKKRGFFNFFEKKNSCFFFNRPPRVVWGQSSHVSSPETRRPWSEEEMGRASGFLSSSLCYPTCPRSSPCQWCTPSVRGVLTTPHSSSQLAVVIGLEAKWEHVCLRVRCT